MAALEDKELAQEWVKNNTDESPNSFRGEELQEAFLAGLEAGKEIEKEYVKNNAFTSMKEQGLFPFGKWHDLQKNPTDVPKENVTVLLLTEVEPVTARYDNKYEAFFRLSDKLDYCIFIAPMSYIAWCEIPKYTEENLK